MTKFFREMADFFLFFWGTKIEDRAIVFYAEHRDYFPYFEGILARLVNRHNQHLCYITSDIGDPMLQDRNPNIRVYYLNRLLPVFMAIVNCRVLVMTLTDLNQFHLRRSINPVHYVYVFHSLVSTHMIYRFGAFNNYDSILCVGPHQVREIRRCEALYELKPKNLVEAGYYRLERLRDDFSRYSKDGVAVSVLVAPTWGVSSLLEVCGEKLLKVLSGRGYNITLRLHPETVKRQEYKAWDGIPLETSVGNMDSLIEADVLITDWSGIGLKYAFGTERPVVFIDTPPKVNNPRYKELGIEPVESFLRDKVGVVVSPDELDTLPEVIDDLVRDSATYRKKIAKLRGEYVYALGHSAEIGVDYIMEVLQQ